MPSPPADREGLRAWLALSRIPGVGPVTCRSLAEAFGSPLRVFEASPDLLTQAGCSRRAAAAIRRFSDWNEVDAELDRLAEVGGRLLTWTDPAYPVHLRRIHDPPPVLYLLGELVPETKPVIAVVGSRRATPYGVAVAARLAGEFARAGFLVVSGMARGIDAAVHQATVAAGGRTAGVLGCGIDVTYPPEHRALKASIRDRGAVLAEVPLGAAPDPHHFPSRNRIISGMALGVLVIEATAESGSLITARLALEQGREVFAVPGNVGSATSVGTNRLIKAGAVLVETAQDVIEALAGQLEIPARPVPQPAPRVMADLTADEAQLVPLLSWEPAHVDELTVRARMSPERLSGILLGLELKGVARQLPGCLYVRDGSPT